MPDWVGNLFLTSGTGITLTKPDTVGHGGTTINASGSSGGGLSAWSALTTYTIGQTGVDRGGIWAATGTNLNSRPISGNTDWTLVAGTPYVDVTLTVAQLWTFPFVNPGEAVITAVNQGTKTFTVDHNYSGYTPGFHFVVFGSTGNDGTYTVVSATLGVGSSTAIVVSEAIPSAVADGSLSPTESQARTILAAPGAGLFVLPLWGYSVTAVGTTPWGSNATASLFYNNVATGDIAYTWGATQTLDDQLSTSDLSPTGTSPIVFTFPRSLNQVAGIPPGMVNRAVALAATNDPSGGGATVGDRTLSYRIYYTISPAAL